MRLSPRLFAPLALATLAGCIFAPGTREPRTRIAATYGYDRFDSVTAVRFTFNVTGRERHTARAWTWDRTTGEVTFRGAGPDGNDTAFAYRHGAIDPSDQSMRGFVDRRFVNDSYWLLFPWHVRADGGAAVTDSGNRPLPIGAGTGECVSVQYPAAGGYTPGDRYDLYLDSTGIVRQWCYTGAGSTRPAVFTWEHPMQAGPLTFAIDHYTADRSLRIWFSDVAVRLTSGEWKEAR